MCVCSFVCVCLLVCVCFFFTGITAGAVEFPDPFWTSISTNAKDFVSHLLVKDPLLRLSADAALQHPWMVKEDMAEEKKVLIRVPKVLTKFDQIQEVCCVCFFISSALGSLFTPLLPSLSSPLFISLHFSLTLTHIPSHIYTHSLAHALSLSLSFTHIHIPP
jgi:serine/threonine protein kinase